MEINSTTTSTTGSRQAHESGYDGDGSVRNQGLLSHKSVLEAWYDIYLLCEFLCKLIYAGFTAMLVMWEQ